MCDACGPLHGLYCDMLVGLSEVHAFVQDQGEHVGMIDDVCGALN